MVAHNRFDEVGSDEVGNECAAVLRSEEFCPRQLIHLASIGVGGIMFGGLKEGFAVNLVSILAVLIFSLSDLPSAGAQALKEILFCQSVGILNNEK
jgi:hypothetical protein